MYRVVQRLETVFDTLPVSRAGGALRFLKGDEEPFQLTGCFAGLVIAIHSA